MCVNFSRDSNWPPRKKNQRTNGGGNLALRSTGGIKSAGARDEFEVGQGGGRIHCQLLLISSRYYISGNAREISPLAILRGAAGI